MQYDLSLLRALAASLPVEHCPLERFESQLDTPVWREGLLYLHPRVILNEPHDLHPLHRAYVAEAARDPKRPPLLVDRPSGRILDGMHLLVHLFESGAATAAAVFVPRDVSERCTLPFVRSLVLCNMPRTSIVWNDVEGALLETSAQVAYMRQGAQLLVRSVQFGPGADKRLSKQFALDVSLVELNNCIFDGIALEATDLSSLPAFKVDGTSQLLRTLPARPEPYAKLYVAYGATIAEGVWLAAMQRKMVEQASPGANCIRTIRTPQGQTIVLESSASEVRLPQASGHMAFAVPPALRPSEKEDDPEKQCVLCMENRADCKLSGCVHRFCRECLDKQSRHGITDCAMCRKRIGAVRLLPAIKRKIVKK